MCDYSLQACKTRDAEVGEVLVSGSIFMGRALTSTKGFHSPSDEATAVCLRPGTELAFEDGSVARFREVDVDVQFRHHDALEFADGTVTLVNNLVEGTLARVLQLPVTEKVCHAEDARIPEELTSY